MQVFTCMSNAKPLTSGVTTRLSLRGVPGTPASDHAHIAVVAACGARAATRQSHESPCLRKPGNHARRALAHLRRSKTCRDGLVPRRARVRRHPRGRAVVGGAQDDGFVRADRRQIQHCGRACGQEQRAPASLGTLAKIGAQRLLRGAVQSLRHHVDDQRCRPVGFQACAERIFRARGEVILSAAPSCRPRFSSCPAYRPG